MHKKGVRLRKNILQPLADVVSITEDNKFIRKENWYNCPNVKNERPSRGQLRPPRLWAVKTKTRSWSCI